eukprot:CAMPEP_0179438024 /NCGR_PEP_ID=MMETSP0799-20121207/21822_1 /TAXON_ID=46947 /ORGANISM="Geminigera cryophila, Strain CCMP2564" /LENGTH=172 /DNA_ID=CAMNT_0021219357 /DNA_START=73 /DNA_END=591 /DNA_ORIENTATION=-
MTRIAVLLVALACAVPATALHNAPTAVTRPSVAAKGVVTAPENLRLRGGGVNLPPTKVLIMTAIGGACGASLRSCMQVWTSDIAKHGPWKHIVAVNAFGALMLGIFTSPKFPKDLVPLFVTAFRIVSAIVTVDAYNILMSGKKDLALFYFLCAVPMNLMMNHLGRTIGGEVL